jgi:hypothetical protein
MMLMGGENVLSAVEPSPSVVETEVELELRLDVLESSESSVDIFE